VPRRTCLDRFGSCSRCGGNSYVLASTIYYKGPRMASTPGAETVPAGGRVLPFKPTRIDIERIAV
ncbi:MAG TPA: hypothetical protein VJX67_25585, partial [Blastocatellia bacterium]|nr:hypothetical protein [Blastocatellia bacterium]